MLLQRLAEYADRLGLPPPLYTERPVRYLISLDRSGRLLDPEPIDTADPKDEVRRRGELHAVPQVQRTSAVRPLLFADNAEYTLGLARETSRPERAKACHAAYIDLVDRCAATTREPAVGAVSAFLHSDPLRQLRLPKDFDPGATITFRVDGQYVVDLPAVQAFWASINDPDAMPDRPAPVMQCVVCGQERPVLRRLKGKLKGIPGGQTSGTALISANAEAFASYGLEESLIAPICAACGERFAKAANSLLADQRQRLTIGNAAFIFWTREASPISLSELFTKPSTEDVRALLDAVRMGKLPPDLETNAFYATALSGSGGRAVVRDWIDTTLGEALRHVATWFQRQRIVGPSGEEHEPLSLYALAAATVRDARRDLPATTPRALWRGALLGTPLPMSLLYEAVRRNRAEQRVTRPRAALIKLVLLSRQPRVEEEVMVRLEPSNPNPAYQCGRLLAVLEEVQRAAIPGVKATLVDRFYGTASAAPLTVFPRLLRGAQPHLAKLERDRPPAYRAFQRRLEEILANIAGFPPILPLADQGQFALGYYHQRAHDRAQALAAREQRLRGDQRVAEELPLEAVEPETPTEEE
jgi:CRISPR-associated protein Csd1